jgi:hypothetical protein
MLGEHLAKAAVAICLRLGPRIKGQATVESLTCDMGSPPVPDWADEETDRAV